MVGGGRFSSEVVLRFLWKAHHRNDPVNKASSVPVGQDGGSCSRTLSRKSPLERQKRRTKVSVSQEHLLKMDRAELPESYRINSAAETRLLAIADNFQRQFLHLYPERKPLLLCPTNECGVKKFVSTTLRPTPPVHPDLFTWQGCASFVADFLSLDPLDPPVVVPNSLFSSSSVLKSQRATCFESATLLCSLLLGAHYDAYCVSGYAVKEMCLLDRRLQECPLLDKEVQQSEASDPELQDSKYTVKSPKELRSHFVTQQERKQQEAEAALLQRQKLEEESESRPADPLRGLRVHCWVLVLSGSRSIQENFFIDPLTGNRHATDDDNFLGVESVWNNLNYYVNMQDCSNGCADMTYDLEDLKTWEPLLYGATSKQQLIQDVLKKKESKMMRRMSSEEEEEEDQPRAFQMPPSWVSCITISKKDLESRFPGGQKVTFFRKAKLEQFAAYLRPDGLVSRLTTFKDLDCTEVSMVKERFQHRKDHLEEKEVHQEDGVTIERFRPGQHSHLLFHRFTDSERQMEFSSAHHEQLVRRVTSPGAMTETFKGRKDFLFYRHAVYDQHSPPISDTDSSLNPKERQLQKVVERFHRNPSKPANADVAERVFLLAERRIEVTYHLEDYRFIPSKRSFMKPQESTEKRKAGDFTPDLVSTFQVDPSERPLGNQTLCEMLLALMKDEVEVLHQIKQSEKEVKDILACRKQEEEDVQLHFSPWTATGTARARTQRQEMELLAAEEQRWLQEKNEDVLAPFLIRLGIDENLSMEDAEHLHQDCLTEFKERLVDQANLIQERCDKETRELQRKQQWYQKNQLSLTEEQKDEYQTFCSEKTLQIHATKKRLSMHKEAAPEKYQTLDHKLKQDPRLAPHLLS